MPQLDPLLLAGLAGTLVAEFDADLAALGFGLSDEMNIEWQRRIRDAVAKVLEPPGPTPSEEQARVLRLLRQHVYGIVVRIDQDTKEKRAAIIVDDGVELRRLPVGLRVLNALIKHGWVAQSGTIRAGETVYRLTVAGLQEIS
jgi:hypothetical protein